jgi:hypothetical protein
MLDISKTCPQKCGGSKEAGGRWQSLINKNYRACGLWVGLMSISAMYTIPLQHTYMVDVVLELLLGWAAVLGQAFEF